MLHNFAVLSQLPVNRLLPSGAKATLLTGDWCPWKWFFSLSILAAWWRFAMMFQRFSAFSLGNLSCHSFASSTAATWTSKLKKLSSIIPFKIRLSLATWELSAWSWAINFCSLACNPNKNAVPPKTANTPAALTLPHNKNLVRFCKFASASFRFCRSSDNCFSNSPPNFWRIGCTR